MRFKPQFLAVALAAAFSAPAFGQGTLVKIDGSSTVYPASRRRRSRQSVRRPCDGGWHEA